MATDTSDYRLTVKEALHSKHQKAHTSLNANIRSCELVMVVLVFPYIHCCQSWIIHYTVVTVCKVTLD